jgi:AcrR family transcriptional regulator
MRARIGSRARTGDNATRELLLNTASDLMVETSSVDVSLSDIEQRSGMNSALVRYYFGNKVGLQLALLRKVLSKSVTDLQHLCAMQISATDKLKNHITGMINGYARYPYVNRLMHHILAQDTGEYSETIASEFGRPLAEAQRSILEEGAATGEFREVDPMLFYFQLVGSCDHFFYSQFQLKHMYGVTEMNDQLKKRYIDHLVGTILHGVVRN